MSVADLPMTTKAPDTGCPLWPRKRRFWTADHAPAYRALCSSCSWKGRRYPFERRALAEAQGRQHAEYHAEAARLAGGGE